MYLHATMKKLLTIFIFFSIFFAYIGFKPDGDKPAYVPASPQRTGNATKGYEYLTTGDYLKSGIPFQLFMMGNKKDTLNLLQRNGINKEVPYEYTAIAAPNGEMVISPNCLQCHAQVFEGKLYVGLGNSSSDFTIGKSTAAMSENLYKMLSVMGGKKFDAAKNFLMATKTIAPYLQTDVKGVNAADRLAAVLAAHRNPVTFEWSEKELLTLPNEVVPTDVPAWWLLKKKNAMFYNGFGRGDFSKFLMASNLLTVSDTTESREVYNHFNDVLSYINSIQPPKYPKEVNESLAAKGKAIFDNTCSGCHGRYGDDGQYPNLLIPASIIGTDSALYRSNYSSPQFVDWFNRSWFTMGENPAQLVPYQGYIAPPLDGVWITAPYLHNGSVPTLEAVLNSKTRPTYWSRDFNKPEYDYEKNGWKYSVATSAEKGVYNTTLPGYGNYGHYFGDKLSDKERKAVVEYLKTL